jgi:hypothetical protein
MVISLNLSVGVRVVVLNFKAEGLDVSDVLSAESFCTGEPSKSIRGQV